MLVLNGVTKAFGDFTAVDKIDISVNEGDLYGFLGPNGAGKTTTIKMIVGLYAPTSGQILVDNMDITENSLVVKESFGYIPDQPFLYEKLSGYEYLNFCGGLYNINKNELKNRIEALIEELKIDDWIYKRTEEYSQGMSQRISIASAFLHNPKLIIIDEPMIGLDPQSAHIIKRVLINKTKEGKAVFMSTHSLHVVEEICNKVAIIHNGSIIFDNKIEKLNEMKDEMNNNFEEMFIELTSD